jgi:putative phosphoribosyl transferase
MTFRDRAEAGRALATQLAEYANQPNVVVLGLPRGGVAVAFEVAKALNAPLDVFVVRKLGTPGHEELAMGAIASGGIRIINEEVVNGCGIPAAAIEAIAREEQVELERREKAFRGDRPPLAVSGKIVILVDDGIATGSTMQAAVAALRRQGPARLVVAVPVAPPSGCEQFRVLADEVVCLAQPESFFAVGQWYLDFSQTTDDQVRDLLERARRQTPDRAAGTP